MVQNSFPHLAEFRFASDQKPNFALKSHIFGSARNFQHGPGYLARRKQPASVESARAFVGELIAERKPADWMVEQWREALNWFFRHAPQRRHRSEAAEATGDGRRHYPVTVREYQDAVPQEPWIEETVRLLRVRHMAYRTEEAYIGWLRRFDRFAAGRGKSLQDEADRLVSPLDNLAEQAVR